MEDLVYENRKLGFREISLEVTQRGNDITLEFHEPLPVWLLVLVVIIKFGRLQNAQHVRKLKDSFKPWHVMIQERQTPVRGGCVVVYGNIMISHMQQ